MPTSETVVVVFTARGSGYRERFEDTTLRGALTQLLERFPFVGPTNLQEIYHTYGGAEQTYRDWKRQAKVFFIEAPLPAPQPVMPTVDGELGIRCPRCDAEIGGFVTAQLPEDDIFLSFQIPAYEFTCPDCGSDLEIWLHQYFAKLMAVFQQANPGNVEHQRGVNRVVEFYRALQTLMAELSANNPQDYQLIVRAVRMEGKAANDSEIAAALGYDTPGQYRRALSRVRSVLRQHPWMMQAFQLRDISDAAAKEALKQERLERNERIAELQLRIDEFSGTLSGTVAKLRESVALLRAENLTLKGLTRAEADTLAEMDTEGLGLSLTVRRPILACSALSVMRAPNGQIWAGELLLWLRQEGRGKALTTIRNLGPNGMKKLEEAYAANGITVFS